MMGSPQALWAAVGHQERLRVSPGDQSLSKEPEDSGYKIGEIPLTTAASSAQKGCCLSDQLVTIY